MEDKLLKDFSTEVKGLDDERGVVEAYANAYNNEDYAGDISYPGSFVKTVEEGIKKLKVYKNHDTDIQIGVPKEINPYDTYGLLTVTQFNMKKSVAQDMYYDIKLAHSNNQDTDLSIGYHIVKRDKKNPKIVLEYSLKEYSFLTGWGCNNKAIVTGIKSLETNIDIIEHLVKMYNLPYSDTRLMKVESILKSLTNEPDNSTHLVEPMREIEIIKSFRNSLSN